MACSHPFDKLDTHTTPPYCHACASVVDREADREAAYVARQKRKTEAVMHFIAWIANHPDVGDSLTAVAREREFQRAAKELLEDLCR